MAKNNEYMVAVTYPEFRIVKNDDEQATDAQGNFMILSDITNFTEAKKLLKVQIRDAITALKLQLKTIGAMRKDTHG